MENLTPKAHATIVVGTTLSVLAGVAVALRLVTKRLLKSGLAADDWWVVASVVMMWIVGSLLAWGKRLQKDALETVFWLSTKIGLLSHDGRGAQGVDRQDPDFEYHEHTIYLKVSFLAWGSSKRPPH